MNGWSGAKACTIHAILACSTLPVAFAGMPRLSIASGIRTDGAATINEHFGIRASTPFVLPHSPTDGIASGVYRFDVPIDGTSRTIELAPFSIRAADFLVQIQAADGSYQTVDVGTPETLRGTVVGLNGSDVGGMITPDGLRAMILLADDTKLWIEPTPGDAAADTSNHVIFRNDDVLPTGGTCTLLKAEGAASSEPLDATGTLAGTGAIAVTELAVDADFDYFTNFGDAALVSADVENIINLINIQYERDVQIRHIITRIIVRTSEPNVYSRICNGGANNGAPCSGSDDCPNGSCPSEVSAETLLNTFKSHWDSAQTNVRRDVAQLFTGKHMGQFTIGVAWMGSPTVATICGTGTSRNFGYSVVETNCLECMSTTARRTDLSAHELGHNWGADHCTCAGWTMNPSITNANRFHPTYSIPDIAAYRDTRTCLEESDELIRLIVRADDDSLTEQGTIQLTAEADFLVGPNQDVTTTTVWSVEPPEAGSVDGNGVFRPSDVDGSVCVTVTATFTSGGIEKSTQTSFTLFDTDKPLAVSLADPPQAAIDARQPSDPDGSDPTGWNTVTITLNGDICMPTVFDFDVTSSGQSQPAPQVLAVTKISPSIYELRLTGHIEPGAWTDITHIETGATTRLGYLPADVNGDGIAGAADILDLIDALNHIGPPREVWSLDIDRSGVAGAADILAVIDLLNGAGGFDPWNNVTLP